MPRPCIATTLRQSDRVAYVVGDCETFRIPRLMSRRTIRIRDAGGLSGVGGTSSAALPAKQSSRILARTLTRTDLAKMPHLRFESIY